MTTIHIVSVVRDFAMYERCLRRNPNAAGCELAPIDNRERNDGIGVCYNRFLDSRPADEDAWYVFCHEDFEPKAPLHPVLQNLGRTIPRSVPILQLDPAPFSTVADAKTWLREHSPVGIMTNAETNGKGEIRISGTSIGKMLSASALKKSASPAIHFAALARLRDVIRESFCAECHPDFAKVDGFRNPQNSANPLVAIHVLYGCATDGSRIYRIKTTLKEALDQSDPLRAYSYQINNIEVLVGTEGPVALPSANTPMDVSILLQSVCDVNGVPIADRSSDRESLWGPVGASTKVRFGLYHQWQFVGSMEECKKDGSNPHTVGNPVPCGTLVETFDCQCLIVHSALVQKHHLRFDENLTFDLYAEDFCIAAHEKADIPSRILPLVARHWSGGSVQPRYYTQEAYLNQKYPNACYTGTSSWIIGGNPTFGRRLTVLAKKLLRR